MKNLKDKAEYRKMLKQSNSIDRSLLFIVGFIRKKQIYVKREQSSDKK